MKKIFLLIALAGILAAANGEVILTGIMDGTLDGGKPKVIELFITGTEDLVFYSIWRSQNGEPFGSGAGSIAYLSGIYSNTFVYLVKSDHVAEFHNVFGDTGIYANVIPLSIITGNGNEGFQVRQFDAGVLRDQVWMEDPADSYRDSYWYRRHGTGPDGGWVESNWSSPGNDALDGLDELGLRAAVPFGTYALEWVGGSIDWNVAGNWRPAIVPGQCCNVIIGDTAAFFPVINNLPASPAVCMNLSLTGQAELTVAAGKALTVHGDLVLAAGPDISDLLLKSDSSLSPSGSLILKGTCIGDIRVERYIPHDNSWHFLSSPVSGQAIQPGFAPAPIDNTFDLYCWAENLPLSSGWMNIRDITGGLNPDFDTEFQSGKGYLAAYSGVYGGSLVKTFSGATNGGTMALVLSRSTNYWNLLGNPYPCTIDWSAQGIDKSAIAGGAMYIWDQSLNAGAGAYRTHDGIAGVPEGTSGLIPAMNGFFVHSIDTGALLLNVDAGGVLVHAGQDFYKAGNVLPAERIRLKVALEGYSDECLVLFDENSTGGYDPHLDVLKFSNGIAEAPEISTGVGGQQKLCINRLDGYPVSIPVIINHNYSDSLEFVAFDFEGLDPAAGLYLEDLLTGISVNLRETPGYRFLHGIPGNPQRFILHIMSTTGADVMEPMTVFPAYISNHKIILKEELTSPAYVVIYDLGGRRIDAGTFSGSYDLGHLGAGAYILEIRLDSIIYRQKILL